MEAPFPRVETKPFWGPIASLAASKSHFVKGQEIEIDSPECWLRAPGASKSFHSIGTVSRIPIRFLPSTAQRCEFTLKSLKDHHDHTMITSQKAELGDKRFFIERFDLGRSSIITPRPWIAKVKVILEVAEGPSPSASLAKNMLCYSYILKSW